MARKAAYVLLCIYFWVGALWQGYFSETAYFSMNLILFAGLAIIVGLKRELIVSWVHLFIFLFVAGYWITVLYAVDVEQAVLESGRVSGLLPLSLLITMISDDQLKRVYRIWPWIGALLTLTGILFGMERNGRLESTLDYANALAIFLLVNIAVCLLSYLQERRITHAVLLAVNAVGLLLTFSRSVWVLWLVMICAVVIWFPELRKRSAWSTIGLAHLFSLVIAFLIKGDGLFFWQRVSSIQSKTSEFRIRLVYWKDSLGMIRDFWWGGAGGGGWSVLVPQYQSQDYFVRYVHNHFVQVALDIGVFGLLVFVVWLGIYYWHAIVRLMRSNNESSLWTKGALLMVTVMLLHAGFDFDLTYPFLFGMLIGLTVPMGGKTYTIRVSGRAVGIATPIAVGIVILWGWLAVGYGYNQKADYHVRSGQFAAAQETFAQAERMLPWSSWVLYGEAKGYVLEGNESGDVSLYGFAKEKLQRAHEMVPRQTGYTELLNQLP
jgi:O-antigen ligase